LEISEAKGGKNNWTEGGIEKISEFVPILLDQLDTCASVVKQGSLNVFKDGEKLRKKKKSGVERPLNTIEGRTRYGWKKNPELKEGMDRMNTLSLVRLKKAWDKGLRKTWDGEEGTRKGIEVYDRERMNRIRQAQCSLRGGGRALRDQKKNRTVFFTETMRRKPWGTLESRYLCSKKKHRGTKTQNEHGIKKKEGTREEGKEKKRAL